MELSMSKLVIILALLLVGCQRKISSTDATPIVGKMQHGEVVAAEYNLYDAVVGIVFYPTGRLNCSGVLIAKNIVLTAAHCIEVGIPQYTSNFKVVFGNSVTDPFREYYSIKSVWSHPDYGVIDNTYTCNKYQIKINDIALLELEKKIDHVRPIPIAKAELFEKELSRSSEYIFGGFGITSITSEVSDEGQKRILAFEESEVIRTSNVFVASDIRTFSDADIASSDSLLRFWEKFKSTAMGDSGGPLFIQNNGKLEVVGINALICKNYDGSNENYVTAESVASSAVKASKWVEAIELLLGSMSMERLKQSLSLFPMSEAYYELASISFKMQNIELANEYIEKSIEMVFPIENDSNKFSYLSKVFKLQTKIREATGIGASEISRTILLRSNKKASKDELKLGSNFYTVGNLEEALNHYLEAIELDPSNFNAYGYSGAVLEQMDNCLASINVFKKLLLAIDLYGEEDSEVIPGLLGDTKATIVYKQKANEHIAACNEKLSITH